MAHTPASNQGIRPSESTNKHNDFHSYFAQALNIAYLDYLNVITEDLNRIAEASVEITKGNRFEATSRANLLNVLQDYIQAVADPSSNEQDKNVICEQVLKTMSSYTQIYINSLLTLALTKQQLIRDALTTTVTQQQATEASLTKASIRRFTTERDTQAQERLTDKRPFFPDGDGAEANSTVSDEGCTKKPGQ